MMSLWQVRCLSDDFNPTHPAKPGLFRKYTAGSGKVKKIKKLNVFEIVESVRSLSIIEYFFVAFLMAI